MNDISLMPTSPRQLMDRFEELGIPYDLHEHEAVFTVAESEKVDKKITACHTRNMYLRTKKKENYLVTLCHDTPIDLKKLEDVLSAKRFSFGSPDRLMEYLGVFPGSVTPFAAVNANPEDIAIILEEKMMNAEKVAYHPLINTMTVVVTPDDLVRFLRSCGHAPRIVDLATAAP